MYLVLYLYFSDFTSTCLLARNPEDAQSPWHVRHNHAINRPMYVVWASVIIMKSIVLLVIVAISFANAKNLLDLRNVVDQQSLSVNSYPAPKHAPALEGYKVVARLYSEHEIGNCGICKKFFTNQCDNPCKRLEDGVEHLFDGLAKITNITDADDAQHPHFPDGRFTHYVYYKQQ